MDTMGLPRPDYEAVRQGVGLSLPVMLSNLAPDLDGAGLARFAQAYSEAFSKIHALPGYKEPLYEGAEDLLAQLEAKGWILTLATGKSRRGVERILDQHGWRGRFFTTLCADDGPGKPDPFMIEACLDRTGADRLEAVMIGDTTHDLKMARAAKVRGIGVTWGFHTLDEITPYADQVVEDFRSLLGALEALDQAL